MAWAAKERTIRNYRQRRAALIERMGGCCERCGWSEDLEFHHLEPREWVCRDLSRWQRIKRYEEEHERGVLELLCRTCNAKAGPPSTDEEVPF